MRALLSFLPVFILYIAIFRFVYLENGLTLIMHVCFPIVIGIILASVLNPMLNFIQRRLNIKNRHAAIFLTFLILILIISLIATIITPNIAQSIKQLLKDLPILFYKADKYLSDFGNENELIKNWLIELTYKLSSIMSSLLNFAIEKVINIFAAVGNTLLAIIISIYVLIDKEKIENWILRFLSTVFGKKTSQEMFKIIHSLYDNVSSYITGKLIASLITGILIFMGSKYIIKTPYPVIDGLIIGITNIIPYFGTLVGGIPILLINVLYNSQKGFLLLIYILIVQQIDSLIIDPRILSSRLSIKPLLIIVSIVIGGGLFGPVGLFLATPVTALTKTSIDAFIQYKIKENNVNKK
ncbi:MAG: AI-2E family transporter [Sedimentibacter sp.]